jgi:hypothetical protein
MRHTKRAGRSRHSSLQGHLAYRHHQASDALPVELRDAMKTLTGAIGDRLLKGPMDQTTAGAIANILNTVAQAVEAR